MKVVGSGLARLFVSSVVLWAAFIVPCCRSGSPQLVQLPFLFTDEQAVLDIHGRVTSVAHQAIHMPNFSGPPCNWEKGDNVFAAFRVLGSSTYEVFVWQGRGGIPLVGNNIVNEVNITRFTTDDFVLWSRPVVVLNIPGGGSPKSISRDEATGRYLFAHVGSDGGVYVYASHGTPTSPNSFFPEKIDKNGTLLASFYDHDDVNLIWDAPNKRWVDMQIMLQVYDKTMCDNVGKPSSEVRRVVTSRVSSNGVDWTGDLGCKNDTNKRNPYHCQEAISEYTMVPSREDPPELEFYRIRPFVVGQNYMAHTLLYAPSPKEVIAASGYGRHPKSCKPEPSLSCCCHGPHMYEEWWIGPRVDQDITLSANWRRPFFDTKAFPGHDHYAMAQPLLFEGPVGRELASSDHDAVFHIWVSNAQVYGLPKHRISGLYAAANGAFSTPPFALPGEDHYIYINANVSWPSHHGDHSGNPEGCDEGCAAYLMAELLDTNGNVFPGYSRDQCIILNHDGLELPLQWKGAIPLLGGTAVTLRVYFRDSIIYSVGTAKKI